MAHYGVLRDYRFSDDVDDIRGATLYGANDEKIGKIDDVIFDHATGTIQYAIVDAGGWLSTKKFLVPSNHIRPSVKDENDFSTDMTKEQIKALPEYDEKTVNNDKDWDAYQTRYRESIETGPVLHKENSTHIITPEPDELPATGSGADDEQYTPQRIAGVFPDAEPGSSKIHLRPAPVAKAEDSAAPGAYVPQDIPTRLEEEALNRRQPTSAGVSASSPGAPRNVVADREDVSTTQDPRNRRWSSFEDHLRRNRVDITASCRSCGTSKDQVA